MADWRRRSIAGGPSPATPDDGIPVAFHLDFFYYPISFPCNGADGDRRMAVASPATTDEGSPATTDEESPATTDEGSPATTDEESPATMDEGSPLQPRQCQPVGTAAGGGGSRRRLSWSPDVSGGRANCPSSSQLHAAICFVNGEAVSLWCSEVLEEDDMRDDDNEGDEATRGDEDDEATSSERGEEDDEATSSEHGEDDDEADEEDEDGNMSPERNDDDDEQDEEDMLTESDDEEEEEPEDPPECANCGSMEKLVMLVPCRHPCYCALCFRLAEWRTGPTGVRCPLCRVKCTRGHPQCGRLGPKRK